MLFKIVYLNEDTINKSKIEKVILFTTEIDESTLLSHIKNNCLKKISSFYGSVFKSIYECDTIEIAETAKLLAENISDKVIILTGAMIPIKFGSSDGLFNLGSAIGFVQSLQYGVYIAMNGRCFSYNKVKKNLLSGIFESI